MTDADRIKWDQRYAEDSYRKHNAVTLLETWLPGLPGGKALDVACGAGRNALRLAQAGYRVDAIDISAEGLRLARARANEAGLDINWIEHDLDLPYAFDTDYDLIVVLWFVDLPLIERLCGCLAPGGYLICEEHLVTEHETGGPSSNAFRVEPGALRQAVESLDILLYEESIEPNLDGEPSASARVVARRG